MTRLLRYSVLLTFTLGFLAACSVLPSSTPALSKNVIKSPNDDRAYRYTVLKNGLQALLISDPETDKSAASLVVFRGSMHDPADYPGLAHFLEHMLFIGTAKYPEVDGYQQFISANGGSSNAYTAHDHTNYFFDIAPPQFPEALDRFAQFFISPLFSEAYVERERNAVHSEYQLQIKDDGWRANAVGKMAMNPEHPTSRFNIGSLDTLGDGVQEALLAFFETQHSADQMALVVLDREPLDAIEALVDERFTAIENKEIGPAEPEQQVFGPEQLPATLAFKPNKELRSVTYRFPTPSTLPYYDSKPQVYLSNLLGHEGEGSLLVALKDRGWVTALFAGGGNLDNDESTIDITMTLTEAGADRIEEISGYLFAYIEMLNSQPAEAWRYEEQATVAELGFRFVEKRGAMATVYQLGPAMMHLPPQDLLRAPFLMQRFDAELIAEFASHLRPDNVLVTLQLPGASTDQEEPWFGVPYSLTPGEIDIIRPARGEIAKLHLPEANPYLPENLELLANTSAPTIAIDEAGAEVWLHTDTSFGAPKANVRFNLNVVGGLVTPEDVIAARLYQRLVADALQADAYPTYLAGISYGLNGLPAGFRVQLSGYNDKQLALLDRVLNTFRNLEIDQERFDILKQSLSEALANTTNERPFNQAYAGLADGMLTASWPADSLTEALAALNPATLTRWRDEHLARMQLFALAHGNVGDDFPAALRDQVAKHIELTEFEREVGAVIDVKDNASIALSVDHSDAAFVAYLQDEDDSWDSRARSALAVQLLRQGYFTSLRTEQQLGYVVAMTNRTFLRRGGIAFIVQSPVASAGDILEATRSYLAGQAEVMSEMSEEAFLASREGLLVRLRKADENLSERTGRYWADLSDGLDTLDSRERVAQAVELLTLSDMQAYASELAGRLTGESLIVYSPGRFDALPEHGERFDRVADFKAALSQ